MKNKLYFIVRQEKKLWLWRTIYVISVDTDPAILKEGADFLTRQYKNLGINSRCVVESEDKVYGRIFKKWKKQ